MNTKSNTKENLIKKIKESLYVDLVDSLPVHPVKRAKTQSVIKHIIVHTTDGVVTPQGLAKYDIGPNHISKDGCPSCTYHYLIHQSGGCDKLVGHETVTWHAGPYNSKSLALALNYKTDSRWESAIAAGELELLEYPEKGYSPSSKAMNKLRKVLCYLCLEEGVPPTCIYGHRELKGTGWTLHKGSKRLRKTCPGFAVDLDELRFNAIIDVQLILKTLGYYTSKVDGKWGPKSEAAFILYLEN